MATYWPGSFFSWSKDTFEVIATLKPTYSDSKAHGLSLHGIHIFSPNSFVFVLKFTWVSKIFLHSPSNWPHDLFKVQEDLRWHVLFLLHIFPPFFPLLLTLIWNIWFRNYKWISRRKWSFSLFLSPLLPFPFSFNFSFTIYYTGDIFVISMFKVECIKFEQKTCWFLS